MTSARNYLAAFPVVIIAATSAPPGRAAQADKPAEVATRGQREAKDITYGDWQKLCFKAGGTPTLCRTSITGKFPTGQMAVRIDLIEREGTPVARLQLFVPVGVYLQQPARVTIDQGTPVRVPYSWCLTNACIAADVASAGMVKQMGAGKTLVLETVDSNLVAVTTSVPLAQFGSAHNGAPTKTLEQFVDE